MNQYEIIDISMPITENIPVYKGKKEKKPIFILESDFETGSIYESRISINLHTGTHLDSQHHMMSEGGFIGTVRLEDLLTRCQVIDCTEVIGAVTKETLMKKEIEKGVFLILKTRNSLEEILEGDFIYLDAGGAAYLAEKKVIGVGTDGLGIERAQPGHETHLTLMKQGIHILEGLRLAHVQEGEYILSAFPIHIPGAEGSPVRAVLLKEK